MRERQGQGKGRIKKSGRRERYERKMSERGQRKESKKCDRRDRNERKMGERGQRKEEEW